MNKTAFHFFTVSALFFCSCNQPGCPETQTNPILSQSPIDSQEYQQELRRLVSMQPNAVDFYFEKRIASEEGEYLALNCYGDGFCGEFWVMVVKDDELSSKLQNNAGYRGAKLEGLEINELEMNGRRELAYIGMRGILD